MSSVGNVTPYIDLRPNWNGVRDQGMRYTCLAFAVSDSHKFSHQLADPLSVEYLFHYATGQMPNKDASHGVSFDAIKFALCTDGQCQESFWSYHPSAPNPQSPPVPKPNTWHGHLQNAPGNYNEVVLSLRQGTPVVLGLNMVEGFRDISAPDYLVENVGQALGGHAVLAVGLSHAGTDPLVLIRNSWGFQWGFGGHAWVDREYLNQHLFQHSIVQKK